MWLTLPFHYRDSGEPCDYSGHKAVDGICPNGCDGARYHYANDGHPECAESIETEPDIVEVIATDILDGPHNGYF